MFQEMMLASSGGGTSDWDIVITDFPTTSGNTIDCGISDPDMVMVSTNPSDATHGSFALYINKSAMSVSAINGTFNQDGSIANWNYCTVSGSTVTASWFFGSPCRCIAMKHK
ncbi:MAG: hypothetical protein IIY21_03940 [Clostridiales bacterium]|nr:hypothetical protein [Clostridiales bacterium]